MNKTRSGSSIAKTDAEARNIGRHIAADLMDHLGLTFDQAMGVVANLAYESKKPSSTVPFSAYEEGGLNRHGTRGAGWAQWTDTGKKGGRRTDFENYANSRNLPKDSYAANFGFLVKELTDPQQAAKSGIPGVYDAIRSSVSYQDAFDTWMRDFEKPWSGAYVNPHLADRHSTGNKVMGSWVGEIQQSLANLGYDIEVDGVWGPQTANALSEYNSRAFPGERLGTKAISTLTPSWRDSPRTMENRSMVDLLDYQDNRSIRQQELDSMRRLSIMNQANKAANQRLAGQLAQYQPGKGGSRGVQPLNAPIGRLPADPKQPAMPGGPIGRLPANPNVPALPGGPTAGRLPARGEGARLARSPITGQQARLSELASMRALDAYRNEPRIVASPLFSGVGRMPMPGEGERLARSPIIGQQARASEIKSMSDLAAMNRQEAEQRASLASGARASENASMASLASMQGAEAARRADLASASRASENRSMADRAAMDRKVAENRALYAPFARAAENKSMRDLASFRNESALNRAAAARASENQSMRDLASMRTENLAVRTPPERAIGSLPSAPIAAVPSAGLGQERRASENRSMQDLAMDRAGVFGPGPSAYSSSNPQTMNFRSMAVSKVEDQVRDARQKSMSVAPASDFRQTPASRLADAYGVYGRSRAAQAMPVAPIANDPRAAASLAGYVQGWGAKPGSIQTGTKMPMDAVMAPRQLQAPAQPPAVPPAQPPTIAYGTPSANRLSQAYTQYGNMRNAAQLAAPQVAAPAPQRQAPAVAPAQPRQVAPQISNEPQYSGRTPGDRARSAAFQLGGIFGYTSQAARGGGGYNPTPV